MAPPRRGGSAAASSNVAGCSVANTVGPRTLSRLLCAAGVVLLAQNVAVLRWSADFFSCDEADARGAALTAVGFEAAVAAQVASDRKRHDQQTDGQNSVVGDARMMVRRLAAGDGETVSVDAQSPARQLSAAAAQVEASVGVDSAASATIGRTRLQRESSLPLSVARDELWLAGYVKLPASSVSTPSGDASGMGIPAMVASQIVIIGVIATPRTNSDGGDKIVLNTVAKILGSAAIPSTLNQLDLRRIVVVLHVGDGDMAWKQGLLTKLKTAHAQALADGHLHVIHTPDLIRPEVNVCPPFCPLKSTSSYIKQYATHNVDLALLMYYSQPLGDYYLHLEDDVHFMSGWLTSITTFLTNRYTPVFRSKEANTPWRLIDFVAGTTCMGKMLQAPELTRLAQFLLLFYDQMPCSQLVVKWMHAMTQGKPIEYWKGNPQVITTGGAPPVGGGVTCGNHQASTCAECPQGQGQAWCNVDCIWVSEQCVSAFTGSGAGGGAATQIPQRPALPPQRVAQFRNPKATMHWNLTVVETYEPHFIYFEGGEPSSRMDSCDFRLSPLHNRYAAKQCWLWAKTVDKGNHLTLVFEHAIALKELYVEFGAEMHRKDVLQHGEVQVAAESDSAHGPATAMDSESSSAASVCGNFHPLIPVTGQQVVSWESGKAFPGAAVVLPVPRVRCLRVEVLVEQAAWLIILRILLRDS